MKCEQFAAIDMKQTGKRIHEICKWRNISVSDIQKELKIGSFQAIYAWFSGKCLPSLDNMYYLSRLLKVPMELLIVSENPGYNIEMLIPYMCNTTEKRIVSYYVKL